MTLAIQGQGQSIQSNPIGLLVFFGLWCQKLLISPRGLRRIYVDCEWQY